jgi:hypothetical protein
MEREFFTTDELLAKRGGIFTADVESFPNYFLAGFRCYDTHKYVYFEAIDDEPIPRDWLSWMLDNFMIVGFNIKRYDLLVLACAICNPFATAATLHKLTHDIIVMDASQSELETEYNFKVPQTNHIDLIEVAPLRGSLKLYAARLHCRHIQDLPFEPSTVLTREQIAITRTYNFNDLENTELLLTSLNDSLNLRAALSIEYRQDLRSKSDAQIAEAVISSEVQRLTGNRIKKPKINPDAVYAYKVPCWLTFQTPELQELLAIIASTKFGTDQLGRMIMPPQLEGRRVTIGNAVYRLGIGGLHSSEHCIGYRADDETYLIDRDVTGYYGNVILTLGLYPAHIGEVFLTVYRTIVARRTKAKEDKNYIVSEGLKITQNGAFGKLGSPYSIFYSPDLMVQITLTGQLALLMLIEFLEYFDIEVISANTDGILSRVKKYQRSTFETIIKGWEQQTGFLTEETLYRAVYSRDVNNYIAIMVDGSYPKLKGAYSKPSDDVKRQTFILQKNPFALVVIDAAVEHITSGKPIEQTICECRAFERFVMVRNATGGAQRDGRYLGKVIRWYYATGVIGPIVRCTNGDKISMSDGGKPVMTMPEVFPNDINYEVYIRLSVEILEDIGFQPKKGEQLRFL